MIPQSKENEIILLAENEGWKPGTIARHVGVHHEVVDRVLKQQGIPKIGKARARLVDPYVAFMQYQLEKYPGLPASTLHQMVKGRGYTGAADHFRKIVATIRPHKAAEAYLRLRTLPGEQAQVDWAYCGKHEIEGTKRVLLAFIMVLSYSRYVFLRFFLNGNTASFLQGHVEAFEAFGGVPRAVLMDNLKSGVLERIDNAIRYNQEILTLACHYRYEPRAVAVARGNQKGRVERAVRYVRTSFLAGRQFESLEDMNRQAKEWMDGISAARKCPEDRTKTVREAFEEERSHLLALPANPFPCEERKTVSLGKTPYVRFDLNDYSVPASCVSRPRKTLVVVATDLTVRITDGTQTVAEHPRSWGKGKQIESPEHIRELEAQKRAARRHRSMDRLHHALPSVQDFFMRVAECGGNLGGTTIQLSRLLDDYGASELEIALQEALSADRAHLGALRQILDQRRKRQNLPPPIQWPSSDDPRKHVATPRSQPLTDYDNLGRWEANHD